MYKIKQHICVNVTPTPLHVLVYKQMGDSGCVGAKNNEGKDLFSLHAMRTFWPTCLEIMNGNDRNMCACETYQSMNDLHTAYLAKIRKSVSWMEPKLLKMPDRLCADTFANTRLTGLPL